MQKLVLFDVDRTLLKKSGHRDSFSHAFREIYGINASVDIIEPSGMTDQQIIIEVLKKSGFTEGEIKLKINDCMDSMIRYYLKIKDTCEPPIVLDGVNDLLSELNKQKYLMGLVTGKLEPIARAKLEQVGINHFFAVGGFGTDNIDRTELVKIAIKKAKEKYGFIFDKNIFLFGDAPQDMNAGHAAGIITIGALTGIFSKEQLKNAGADFIVQDLSDTDYILSIIKAPKLYSD